MLHSLSVQDIGLFDQERPFSVDLDARVVGITGYNGSGKSTLLRALMYGLSGESTYLSLVDVAGSKSVGARPEVITRFRPNENADIAEMTRSMAIPQARRRLRRKLTYQGTTVTNEAEILQQLTQWYGAPPKVFAAASYVPQGELASLVSVNSTERKQAIGRLLGLEHADKVYRLLGEVARNAVVTVTDTATVDKTIADCEQELQDIDKRLLRLPELTASDVQALYNAIREIEQCLQSNRERKEMLNQIKQVEEDEEQLLLKQRQVQDELHLKSDLEQEYNQLQQRVNAATDYQLVLQQIDQYARQKQTIKLNDPGPEPVCDSVLIGARMQVGVWRRVAGMTIQEQCPTCLRPVTDDFLQLIQEAKQHLEAYESLEAQWRAEMTAYQEKKQEYDRSHARLIELDLLLRNGRARKTAMDSTTGVLGDVLQITELRQQLQQAARQYVRITELRKRVLQFEPLLELLRSRKHQLIATLQRMPPEISVENPEEANKRYQAANTAYSQRLVLEDRRAHVTFDLQKAVAVREKLLTRNAEAASKLERINRANRIRDVFHKDAAPAQVVYNYILSLQDALNEALQLLDAPYRIRIEQDCEFFADFADGSPSVPSSRLSGGLQVVLAWAWVLARQTAHGENLWLLCLDEPTYGLDRIRREALKNVLNSWRNTTGRQLVLVTHDRSLAACCDRVLDVSNR